MAKPTTLAKVSRPALTTIHGWEDLSEKDKQLILRETTELNQAIVAFGRARVAIGEKLLNIRNVLEPKRMFTSYLKSVPFNISVATAYRYIEIYQQARELFSAPVMRLALAMGMDVVDPKLVKRNPPPDTSSEVKVMEYLQDLAHKQKAYRAADIETDSEVLHRESFNLVRTRLDRLPSRQRKVWLKSLIGMLLTYAGEDGEGEPIPDDYIVPRGRPRTIEAGEKAV